MKRFLLNCALAIGLCSVAQANCCPVQYDNYCNDSGFDGWYIGGNIGAFTHEAHRNDRDGFFDGFADGFTIKNTDVTAGLQLGYDWACNGALFGLVGDWSWVNTRSIHKPFGIVDEGEFDNFTKNRVNWFSTIRFRLGLNVCNALLYATGGAAAARFETHWQSESFFEEGAQSFKSNDTRWGWVGGLGAEVLLGCNWSLGVEFLCMHFDERVKTVTAADGVTYGLGLSDNAYVGRLLLNYRFGDLCGCW